MKYFYFILFFLSVYGAQSQNLHNNSNAASITNEGNSTTGWTGSSNISSSNINPFSGSFALRVVEIGRSQRDMRYTFSAVIGEQYVISIWAREGDSSADPGFANWTGFSGFSTTAINGANWVEYNWTLTATNTNPIIRVYTSSYSNAEVGNDVFIDNVSIQLASTVDTTPPSIPAGLASANVTGTSLDLNWVASTDNVGVTDYEVFQDGVSLGLTGGLLTQNISELSGSTSYAFTVESIDGSGNRSGLSTALVISTLAAGDTTPPSIPAGLASANITSTSLDLNWVASTDNIGVTDYEVFQDDVSLGLTGGLLTQNITGLTGSTSYVFTVESIDGSGNRSGLSTALVVSTLAAGDITPPSIPTGLASANITSTSLDLNWVASTDNIGVTDYEIFQDGVSLGLTGGLLTQNITGLTGSTSYAFTVESIDGAGNRSGLSTALAISTLAAGDITPPSIPTGLATANITSTSLDLNWVASTDNIGVTDYEIFQDGVSLGLTSGLLTQNITGLIGGTSYSFTVESIDGSGNRSGLSTALAVSTLATEDVTPPSIPTGLASANITSTSLDLNWVASTDNIGVTDYEVFQDGISLGLTGGLLTRNISGLVASTTYSFTVESIDGVGNRSAASVPLQVTTLETGGLEINYNNSNANLESVDWTARDLFAFRNVGIGTTNTQGYRLAVAGNVIAEEIKVQLQTAWPDYVFKSEYKLPLLEDVEEHIKEKGHLPNVPSAKEVEANGIKLGEMNVVLLEKIEELTLYILQQEKRLKVLELAVSKLKE